MSSLWIPAIVIPLVLAELGGWATWLSVRVVRYAARRLNQPEASIRYAEEFTATINDIPGQLTKLAAAIGILAATPILRRVLATASEIPMSQAIAPQNERGHDARPCMEGSNGNAKRQ